MKANPLLQALFVIGERGIFLVSQVTIFVLVSRFLGREIFGQYSLMLTWATLFQTLANFGVTECLAREIGREPHRGSTYFTHGLLLAVGFAVIAMAVMVPAAWCMHYGADVTVAILLAGGTLIPAGVIGACRGVLLANRRVEYMMGVALAENLVLLPLNAYWVVTQAGLLPMIATIVVAKIVASGVAYTAVHGRVTPVSGPLQRSVFRQLWRVTTPFGIAAQLPAIRFDIFLLSKLTTFGTLGLYTAASKVAELMLIFPLAFYLTMLPRVAGDLAEEPEPKTDRLREALAWYFAAVIPVGLGVIGLAAPLMHVVYGTAFVAAAPLLQLQMVAFLLVTVDVILMMICRATGFQRADLGFVVVTAVSNVVLNVLLIPHLVAAGAALAAVLSIGTGLTLRWRLVTRSIVRLHWTSLVGAPLAAAVLFMPVLLLLAERLPWALVALGYVAGYGTVAALSFPFLRNAVRTVLRQHNVIAE